MVQRVLWGCPYCGKQYMIPADAESPTICPRCNSADDPVPQIHPEPPASPPPVRLSTHRRRKPQSGLGVFIIKCLMVGVTLLWPAMILGTATLEYGRLTEGARPFAYGQWIVGAWVFDPDEVWEIVLAKKAKFHTFVYGIEITMLFVLWFAMKPSHPATSTPVLR